MNAERPTKVGHHRLLPYAALLTAITTFCLGTSFAKRLFPLVGAEGTAAYRVGFAAIILVIIARPWRSGLARREFLGTMPYGFALGGMNLCFYLAIRSIPLGIAIAIEFLGPLAVSFCYSREPRQFIRLGAALCGLLLILPFRRYDGAFAPIGVLFALAAAACWALYIVFGKRTNHLPAGYTVALGMSAAAIVVVPVGVHHAGPALLTPSWLLLGLGAALISSVIPYSLEMFALRRIPAGQFGLLLSIEPAVGAAVGALTMGERLSAQHVLAISLIVGAAGATVAASEK